MRPRWIDDDPHPTPPRIGTTVIASWWPGRYVLVSTIFVEGTSPLARMVSSIKSGVPYNEASPLRERFVTHVFACDKHGIPRSWDDPLFERVYATREEAEVGHRDVVTRFT
jgi:hypothetical protein